MNREENISETKKIFHELSKEDKLRVYVALLYLRYKRESKQPLPQ